jgi:arsenite oxidase small subunit
MSNHQSRRAFLRGGAAVATATAAASTAKAASDTGIPIAALTDIKPGSPVDFDYPEGALAYLVDMGRAVENGTGPNSSLVAYSGLCQHRGCGVDYDGEGEQFVCPCHRSVFSLAKGGMCIEGPSQRGLPRVTLEVRDGEVFATGIENGPVYGRACDNA